MDEHTTPPAAGAGAPDAPAAQEKLPTSKIERASRFLKTGLKVGGNYVQHYTKKALLQKPDRDALDAANATDLLEGMTELRGSALKLAQMMSMDQVNFSTAFTDILAKAQYSVPPMSAPLAVQVFRKTVGKSPEDVFDRFNPNAVRAASMGQVHEAWKDGMKLAVKIQYPGVAESVQSDLRIMRSVAPTFVKASAAELAPYFEEVEARMLEETDYEHELRTSLEFAEACRDVPGVYFPQYLAELSGPRVLTMTWIPGMHLKEFLATADAATKQRAAQTIWDLYDHQMHVLRRVNADPHPGNFLFEPDGRVGVLDFGCTKRLTQELYEDYFRLANPRVAQSPELLVAALHKLEILRPTDSPAKAAQITDLFGRLVGMLTRPLHERRFHFNNPAFFQEVAALGMEIKDLREVRGSKEFLFVNRTFFGLFLLMQQLDATVETDRAPALAALLQ